VAGRRAHVETAAQREVALSRHVQPFLHGVQAEQANALEHLARADRRSWLLIEPTLLTMLPQLPYDVRHRLIELMRERGTVARAPRRPPRPGRGRAHATETLGTLAPQTCARDLVRLLADYDPE